MNVKAIIAGVVVVVFIIFASMSFFQSNVEYVDVAGAMKAHKKVQLKGVWNKEKGKISESRRFIFYLVDDQGKECKVVLDGVEPDNFTLATTIVAKGRYVDEGYFHATEILTKCPSKYEAQGEQTKKTV